MMKEIRAVRYKPFFKYGNFPLQTTATEYGTVRKSDLANFRSTRILNISGGLSFVFHDPTIAQNGEERVEWIKSRIKNA